MYMGDINMLAKNETELATQIQKIYIQIYRNGIWGGKICEANNEWQKKTDKRRNKTAKSLKI